MLIRGYFSLRALWQIRISSLVCRISFRTLEHSDFEFVSELVRHSVWRIRISIFVLLPVPPGIEACPPILLADSYFGYLNLSASGGFVSDLEFMASAIPYGRISDFLSYL